MALYLRKRLENKAEIAVWQVTETEDELRNLVSVPTDELEEISLYRDENHRRQKLAVRALLNEVFEEKMYLNHHDNGKPYLENSVTNISITHTDKYVAIIISDDDELGIDIELVMRFNHLILCHPVDFCFRSFQHQRFFPMSQLLTSGGLSVGASASVLPMNIQG